MLKSSINTVKLVVTLILVVAAVAATTTTASASDALARAPRIGFKAPVGWSIIPSFFVRDSSGGVGDWRLQRHVARLVGGHCRSWWVDLTVEGSHAGTFKPRQTLIAGSCYFWTLRASDSVGNQSPTIRSRIAQIPYTV